MNNGELTLPNLGAILDRMCHIDNPFVKLQLSIRFGIGSHDAYLEPVLATSQVVQSFSAQHQDGSWGSHEAPLRRILPTLWMCKALAELGVANTPEWRKGTRFLQEFAHTKEGVFSLDGTPQGVLSCYVGMAASLYIQGHHLELAESQIQWLLNHQEVKSRGVSKRNGVKPWSPHLKTRYGGCMANTTCLVGLVKAGGALNLWSHRSDAPQASKVASRALLAQLREVFLERSLLFRSNGQIIPLAVAPKNSKDLLLPTFPLGWRTDAIEVIDMVARSGPADARCQPAVDKLMSFRLADGGWPLLRTFRPDDLPLIERRSKSHFGLFSTLRAIDALHALGAPF